MSTISVMKTQASRLKPLAALIPLLIAGHAGAVGVGQVAAGIGTIGTSGPTTTINQESNRLIVNWNNFDIANGERVQINQPTAQSVILNRVNSASRTQIDGALNANGRVFVVNPNGVVVGKTGSVNANGVVLSTLDVRDNDFMRTLGGAAPLAFRKVSGAADAAVVNDGTITAGSAGVSLFGSQVINGATGKIIARGGSGTADLARVNLVASNIVDASEARSTGGLITDGASRGIPSATVVDGLVANDGAIKVDAGEVLLSATGGRGTRGEAIRNTGSIDASGVDVEFPGFGVRQVGGNVFVNGGGDGTETHLGGSINARNLSVNSSNDTLVDGTINADGISIFAAGPGKDVTLRVADNARLDGDNIILSGDKVVVTGRAVARTQAQVTGHNSAEVREGALDAPNWLISNGGKVTTGSGPNGPTVPVYGADGYDQYGYDRNGFDRNGFDKDGFNAQGFDRDGFNHQGFNAQGYDRYGFNAQGIDRDGYGRDGFNAQGFDRGGYNRQGFNAQGYDRYGFNAQGFDKDGYGRDGYNAAGFDRNGVARPGTGNPGGGENPVAFVPPYSAVYGADGYDQYGLDRGGYDRNGYNKAGVDRNGMSVLPPVGAKPYTAVYGADGYDQGGYDRDGMNRDGYYWTGYNAQGYFVDGFNSKGYNKYGYNRFGRDVWGRLPTAVSYAPVASQIWAVAGLNP
ncbi:filamentous hemagglutinin N-terminal domain-containing protein [Burkholderia pyrrocinia]|uniref:two-partner secretion domain-containing protein n=1 Tax=Burkholderia pyrrocinia TaxID=60550 RepID=UPI00158BC011|nr:filamentous hemagglutinin N-terminal domain-containing protein [Burkholderia pyrrocinia]